MSQCFIDTPAGFDLNGAPLPLPTPITPRDPERDRLLVLLIGSRATVLETIHNLHRRGFAKAGDWSPLLPGGRWGEVISILGRDRPKES